MVAGRSGNLQGFAVLHGRFRQLSFDLRDQVLDAQAILAAQVVHVGAVFDELIGPTDLNHGRSDAPFVEQLKDRAAVTAHEDVVFQGDNDLGGAAEELGDAGVK